MLFNKYLCYVLTHVQLFTTSWIVACQAPLSMVFLTQDYWSRFPFLSPGDLLDPEIKPMSPALQADSLPLSHLGSPVRLKKQYKLRPQVRMKALTSQGDLDDLDTLERTMSQCKMLSLDKM